jgi:hypothetical protein
MNLNFLTRKISFSGGTQKQSAMATINQVPKSGNFKKFSGKWNAMISYMHC